MEGRSSARGFEGEARRRPRESSEDQAGDDGKRHQPEKGLKRRRQVGQQAVRGDPAVSKGGERLGAEEKSAQKAVGCRAGLGAAQVFDADPQVDDGEHHIGNHIPGEDHSHENGPGDVDHEEIGMNVPPGGAAAANIELPVRIDNPMQVATVFFCEAGVEGRFVHNCR